MTVPQIISVAALVLSLLCLCIIAHILDARKRERTKNQRLLRAVRAAHSRKMALEEPLMGILRPALLEYRRSLHARDGVAYRDVTWQLGEGTVTFSAEGSQYIVRMHIAAAVFDAPDPCGIIREMVWECCDERL